MQNVSCSPMGLVHLFLLTQREGCSRGEHGVATFLPVCVCQHVTWCCHSVQLARRVLHLEKINVSLRDQAKRDKEKISELTEELASGRTLLEGAQQPYTYLVSRIKEQKELHLKSKQRLSQLEEEMEVTKREKAALVEAKNQMAADLERLLNHREVRVLCVCVGYVSWCWCAGNTTDEGCLVGGN